MVVNPTDGPGAALFGDAGVAALLADTCKEQRAVAVDGAFGFGC